MADESSYPCDICGIPYPSGRALGGHRKTHNKKRLPTPECFTDDKEWEYSVSQLRIEQPDRMVTREYALAEACAVCPLEYMRHLESQGRCHPPASADPQRDLELTEIAV